MVHCQPGSGRSLTRRAVPGRARWQSLGNLVKSDAPERVGANRTWLCGTGPGNLATVAVAAVVATWMGLRLRQAI